MPSLRRHLLLGAALVITAVFAGLGCVLYVAVRAWLIAELDRGLLAEAEALKAATEVHGQHVRIDYDGEPPAQFARGSHAQFFELWADGRPADRSRSLGGQDLPALTGGAAAPTFAFGLLPGGKRGRLITMRYEIPRGSEEDGGKTAAPPRRRSLALVVASDTSELSAALAQLRWLLLAACGAALATGLGLLAWTIRRALRPVNRIADRIERVGRANLADRLEVTGVPRELLPIVQRLNEMLARIEAAFDRERAFTADVAHELRTPLAGLETTLEVCSTRPRQPQEYQQVVHRCLKVARNMHAMVDSLLTLARADAGTLAVSKQPFCLDALLEECWQPFANKADSRRLRVTRTVELDGPIRADRDKLRQVLLNLFDNAVSYCDEAGKLAIVAVAEGQNVCVTVSNTGSLLSQEQANRAADRFWRGDTARAETGVHCGLGLAIVSELVALMGGQMRIQSAHGQEFRVCLTLPIGPTGDHPGSMPSRRSCSAVATAATSPGGNE